jgi:hypothetical protein
MPGTWLVVCGGTNGSADQVRRVTLVEDGQETRLSFAPDTCIVEGHVRGDPEVLKRCEVDLERNGASIASCKLDDNGAYRIVASEGPSELVVIARGEGWKLEVARQSVTVSQGVSKAVLLIASAGTGTGILETSKLAPGIWRISRDGAVLGTGFVQDPGKAWVGIPAGRYELEFRSKPGQVPNVIVDVAK